MPHLIFLHGWGAHPGFWPGQAQECPVSAPYFPAWDPQWLVGYLQQVPLQDTVVVGWSLGGMLLLEAVAAMGRRPGGLVLVAAPASFCRRADYPLGQSPALVRAMRRALQTDARLVLRDFARRCLAPGEEAFAPEVAALFEDTPVDAGHLAAGLDFLLERDLRPLLPRVPGGAVIIQGDQDRIVPPEQTRFLRDRLAGSRLYTLPGGGHLPFLTQPAVFKEILWEVVGGGPGS